MSLERGRCLFSLVILTGFLLGTAHGQNSTTTATPMTTTLMTTTAPTTDTVLTTTVSPTTPDLSTGNDDTVEVTGPTEFVTEIVTEIVNSSTTMITSSLATMNVTIPTVDVDDCIPDPCMNGGTCEPVDGMDGYTCDCAGTGFGGTNCSMNIDDCSSDPCMNNGTCTDGTNNYTCDCTGTGFEGPNCTINIDNCTDDSCYNGGTCNDLVNDFSCTCPEGFNGTRCEFDINACEPNPCENEVNCTNHVMSTGDATYTCYCMPGWTGTNCTDDIRECDSTPCQNNGTCHDDTNFYNCTCEPGFNGTYCEEKCPAGTFGYYCEESCTCVASANCSNVDGNCTCDQEFCDKRDLQVNASRLADGPISRGDRFTLMCQVNLAGEDLEEVSWYRDSRILPNRTNEKYEIKTNPDMGEYNITIQNADAKDTGNYICTAVAKGNQFNYSSDIIVISIIVPGTIDLELSKRNDSVQLNETASLNCTVFSSSDNASIAWKRKEERLINGVNRVNITEGQRDGTGGIYFSSLLKISNIIREDNGAYTCEALDGAEYATDSADFNISVQEVAELANPRYTNVLSGQISLEWDFTIQGNAELNCTAQYTIQGTNQTKRQAVEGSPPGVVTNLDPYTTYKFELTCVNLVGSSLPLVYPPNTTLAGKPSSPRNVGISDREARQVRVSWDRPEVTNGPIDRYDVEATTGDPRETVQKSFEGNMNSGILDELTPYKQYSLTVKAVNLNGPEGDQLSDPNPDPVGFTTSQDKPEEPHNLHAVEEGGVCKVSWEVPREPNGIIIRYTLYTEIYRSDTDTLDGTLGKFDTDEDQREKIFDETDLQPYSIFRFSVTAYTVVGEGLNATTQDTCVTPQGVPIMPPSLPTPTAISQRSFTTILQPYDERNGPVSCYEVIVVELQSVEAGGSLNSADASYSPSQIRSYEEAMDTIGKPYRAMVFKNRPLNDVLVIGATTENITTCYTGDSAGSGRRRREITSASNLKAVNGPLNTGRIYSSFVRVYTPNEEQTEMVFYENGPFMAPVTLQPDSKVGVIVGAIFGVLIALALVTVILLILYRRRNDYPGDPLMTRTSDGPRENGNGTVIGMENLGIEDELVVKPIKLENLEKAIREKAKDEKRIFWEEYKALPNRPPPMVTMNSSNLPANRDKNRYINIIAYDHTRVKLKHMDGIEGSDYINASYVNGYQSPDKFIAAQGPKDNTLEDFWRMIWECNCSTIVMLTKCVEDGKDKCSQYWPNTGSVKYGRFEVKLDQVKETAEYVIRSFFVSEHGKESGQRSITQFHFLGWPDHGQPDYPSPMLCLIKRVRHLTSKMNHRANIVVHCSAGVGRTGTYIVIDAMLDMIKHEKQVDIYNFIHEIRQQRNTLVQSFVQYFFIHIALLEEHLFGHMDVAMSDFPAYYQQLSNKSDYNEDLTKLEEEFRRACKLGVNGTEQTYANIDQNKDKNRIGHILPFDKNIVKLERLIGEEFSDYINASYITGYDRKNMYIATQGPLPNTVADFWRMVWESQTSTIVMLTETNEKGHEMCAQYWPLEVDEVEEHGDISVTLVEESDEDEAFTVRDVEISHAQMKDIRKIRQFHFRGWPEVGVPDTGIDLMRLVNKSHLHQKERGAHPIVVHCSAGAGRTGVFIALNVLMSRMEEESMIDVFQTVRGLRQQRPHMVQDLAQYKFCYLAMVEYIQDQSTEYQNYVPRV